MAVRLEEGINLRMGAQLGWAGGPWMPSWDGQGRGPGSVDVLKPFRCTRYTPIQQLLGGSGSLRLEFLQQSLEY